MAKTITDINGTYKLTRAMRKSQQRLIPATPAPTTRAQRIKRALIG